MKSILYSILFLLTATNSVAQTHVSDTTTGLSPRGNVDYYIDGIKVQGNRNLPKSSLEEVSVITGGQVADYSNLKGSIIWITKISVSDTLNKRYPVHSIYFDMDKIKKDSRLIQLVKTNSEILLETIEVIIGGLPGTYGDLNSSIIRVNTAPATKPSIKVSDKEQKTATEKN